MHIVVGFFEIVEDIFQKIGFQNFRDPTLSLFLDNFGKGEQDMFYLVIIE